MEKFGRSKKIERSSYQESDSSDPKTRECPSLVGFPVVARCKLLAWSLKALPFEGNVPVLAISAAPSFSCCLALALSHSAIIRNGLCRRSLAKAGFRAGRTDADSTSANFLFLAGFSPSTSKVCLSKIRSNSLKDAGLTAAISRGRKEGLSQTRSIRFLRNTWLSYGSEKKAGISEEQEEALATVGITAFVKLESFNRKENKLFTARVIAVQSKKFGPTSGSFVTKKGEETQYQMLAIRWVKGEHSYHLVDPSPCLFRVHSELWQPPLECDVHALISRGATLLSWPPIYPIYYVCMCAMFYVSPRWKDIIPKSYN
uniref:Uncharacterized protein n=1 Tax=Salix viminalis TaxID=40686 RepID=A0A6N2KX86_SALVM